MAKRVFKSKKKLSNTMCVYRKWNEWDVGDILVAKFVKEVTDKYDKPNWIVQVEEAFFVDKKLGAKLKGQMLGLNSNGELDRSMKEVEAGQMIQIEYKGMERMDGGPYKGKDKHLLEVDLVTEAGDEDEEEETDEEEVEEDEDDL